jgi:dihydrofolate reductase
MKTTLFMAISANGFVARRDGDEDFLPHEGWLQTLDFAKKYGHLIWGRKTYEAVKGWGGAFMKDIENIPVIIVSKSKKFSYPENVTECSSPEEAMSIVEQMGHKRAFLPGGPTLNTAFVKAGLVDEIILNYNPTILANGIKLFSESDFELKLELEEVKKLSSNIVQMRYSVIEVLSDKSAQ